ncbi:hypothetical protein QYE76_006420 [Lolium multiflorum]|uniref:Uncharacterized protein n=1 Tax=Lolium multiflorum TaxID=4521 RepID=A0AAD8RUV0_LOLMU|nr:hypothetical protein QYE76_006420 [Lolium multiflorum]
MSKTGLGIGMFNMGLFIGLQDKIIMTGPGLTTLGMVLRFVAAPASTMVGAILLGLRGDVLRVAIIQAALPQSVGTFFFAPEYDLHADVLSTAHIARLRQSLRRLHPLRRKREGGARTALHQAFLHRRTQASWRQHLNQTRDTTKARPHGTLKDRDQE